MKLNESGGQTPGSLELEDLSAAKKVGRKTKTKKVIARSEETYLTPGVDRGNIMVVKGTENQSWYSNLIQCHNASWNVREESGGN